MVQAESSLSHLRLIGGHGALDFANTIQCRNVDNPCDLIDSYDTLVEWSVLAGILAQVQVPSLQHEGALHKQAAATVLDRAVALRLSIHDIFFAVAGNNDVDLRALAALNSELSSALCRRLIGCADGGFRWVWQGSEIALDQMLWPIAQSAAELLTSSDTQWIRECQAHDCDRLFLDTSRNHRRQWCSMEWCGNREKARRCAVQRRQVQLPTTDNQNDSD